MKKIIIITVIAVAAILTGMFVLRIDEKNTSITDLETKVGVILNGLVTDKSWNQSHYNSLQKTADELNLDMTYIECVTPDVFLEKVKALAEDGCEIITVTSEEFSVHIPEAAEAYPEIYFFQAA